MADRRFSSMGAVSCLRRGEIIFVMPKSQKDNVIYI